MRMTFATVVRFSRSAQVQYWDCQLDRKMPPNVLAAKLLQSEPAARLVWGPRNFGTMGIVKRH